MAVCNNWIHRMTYRCCQRRFSNALKPNLEPLRFGIVVSPDQPTIYRVRNVIRIPCSWLASRLNCPKSMKSASRFFALDFELGLGNCMCKNLGNLHPPQVHMLRLWYTGFVHLDGFVVGRWQSVQYLVDIERRCFR